MVVIRLARGGAKKRPFYNLVVADSRKPATGKFIERVGFYDPKAPEGRESLRVAMDRLSYWRNQGAKMSPTVARLVKTVEVPANAAPAPAK
ncbi:MAG: 30S ribosomal protein S16 [Betaproteobacteria bacterium RIFCSPLOWO2_12_61_14]|nr:MAG: 30S ribosomal protein S16 [Betaproteobacteria bacterium RIFCSPLOWO2_12_61_14]